MTVHDDKNKLVYEKIFFFSQVSFSQVSVYAKKYVCSAYDRLDIQLILNAQASIKADECRQKFHNTKLAFRDVIQP